MPFPNEITNAEMPRETVTLSNGEKVELNSSAYVKYRTADKREDRALVFDKFFNNFGKFEKTIGSNLAGHVKGDYVYAKNKNYETALEAALNVNNVPTSVYTTLIKQINNSLPTLHRFLNLKKEMAIVIMYDKGQEIINGVEIQSTRQTH